MPTILASTRRHLLLLKAPEILIYRKYHLIPLYIFLRRCFYLKLICSRKWLSFKRLGAVIQTIRSTYPQKIILMMLLFLQKTTRSEPCTPPPQLPKKI